MAATCAPAPRLFSGGNEIANLMLSTGVLEKGWSCVTELQRQPHLQFSVNIDYPKFTIVAFSSSAAPAQDEAQGGLDPSLEPLDPSSSPLGFLITKDNPRICIHRPSLSAFHHLLTNDRLMDQLKKLQLKKPSDQKQTQLILVGHSQGGSVAALFALWLLKKRSEEREEIITPICITYGSPFVGDGGLQKAISKVEKLKAHFWHVVGDGDVVPRKFLVPRLAAQLVPGAPVEFKPFGTYFLCSNSGCTCIDHPESVLDVLQISSADMGDKEPYDYGAVLQRLKEKTKHRSNAEPQGNSTLRIGLALQLGALGIAHPHQSVGQLLKEMEERETDVDIRRKGAQNPSKKFNDAKKQMARLEWYKKRCEGGEMDYYDCFKERRAEWDYDVINFKNFVNRYWKEKVEEAENNPQTSDAPLRDRFLFSGTTYKRMVEPLDIADYYRKSRNRDYMNKKRAHHYVTLEKWHEDSAKSKKEEAKEKKAAILTEDSCFWAHVEEAALMLEELKRAREEGDMRQNDLRCKLKQFEGYVWKLISNHALSTTVFFERSTFMKWWKQYERELEHNHNSEFTSYMKNGRYVDYR